MPTSIGLGGINMVNQAIEGIHQDCCEELIGEMSSLEQAKDFANDLHELNLKALEVAAIGYEGMAFFGAIMSILSGLLAYRLTKN